jgi:hypothetical protein|tara:strand:- start:831 stop:1124 length:294 start_codon:yes stop_codon:yes gene_type:complete
MNFFKKIFKSKKTQYVEVSSISELRLLFNKVGRKNLISSLPKEKQVTIKHVINEGYKSLNQEGPIPKEAEKVNHSNIISLLHIFLLYGKNIKITKKK